MITFMSVKTIQTAGFPVTGAALKVPEPYTGKLAQPVRFRDTCVSYQMRQY